LKISDIYRGYISSIYIMPTLTGTRNETEVM